MSPFIRQCLQLPGLLWHPPGASRAYRCRPIERRRSLARLWLAALLASCAACVPALSQATDPPGRVGRIAFVSGAVSVDTESGPEPALLNWPVVAGTRVATGPAGRVEVRIGSISLRLDADSVLALPRLDDESVQLVLERGVMAITVRNPEWLPELDLTTPRARVDVLEPGRYRIEARPAATRLAVREGLARLAAGRMVFTVRAGETGELSGEPYAGFALVGAQFTAFDEWSAARDREQAAPQGARLASPEMTGIESLDQFGRWNSVESYGEVWFPSSVPSGWAPYSQGQWVWIAPWGWTWLDAAPWGFAPFHYGRWVLIGGAWGWVPGAWTARPVYAPALVAWLGAPGGVNVSGSVGWLPLAPGEAYLPWYATTRPYLDRVNRAHLPPGTAVPVAPRSDYRHARSPGAIAWIPHQDLGRAPVPRVRIAPPPQTAPLPAAPPPPAPGTKRHPTPIPLPRTERPEVPGATPAPRPWPAPIPPPAAVAPSPPVPGQAAPALPHQPRPGAGAGVSSPPHVATPPGAPASAAPRFPVAAPPAPATPPPPGAGVPAGRHPVTAPTTPQAGHGNAPPSATAPASAPPHAVPPPAPRPAPPSPPAAEPPGERQAPGAPRARRQME